MHEDYHTFAVAIQVREQTDRKLHKRQYDPIINQKCAIALLSSHGSSSIGIQALLLRYSTEEE
eukprot:scaffold3786_cov204-Alexandrium_tamarense.AAC.4